MTQRKIAQISTVVAHGDFPRMDEWLVLTDPIYYPEDPMNVYVRYGDWERIHVFTVEDDDGVRALVATNGSPVPPELLDTEPHGAFVKLDEVGVDSGQMCIAYETERILFQCDTYHGDGQYPVVAWGTDGRMTAFAVLMDVYGALR